MENPRGTKWKINPGKPMKKMFVYKYLFPGKAQVGDYTSGLVSASCCWLLLSFTNTKIRNYFDIQGELALWDSNEYFWFLIYRFSVAPVHIFMWGPREEGISNCHHTGAKGIYPAGKCS